MVPTCAAHERLIRHANVIVRTPEGRSFLLGRPHKARLFFQQGNLRTGRRICTLGSFVRSRTLIPWNETSSIDGRPTV